MVVNSRQSFNSMSHARGLSHSGGERSASHAFGQGCMGPEVSGIQNDSDLGAQNTPGVPPQGFPGCRACGHNKTFSWRSLCPNVGKELVRSITSDDGPAKVPPAMGGGFKIVSKVARYGI